jgi:hypothetical protein
MDAFKMYNEKPIVPRVVKSKPMFLIRGVSFPGIIFVRSSSTTPSWNVLVYTPRKRYYGVKYMTSFERRTGRNIWGSGGQATYKNCIILALHYNNQRQHNSLYDFIKGIFSGSLFIPMTDVCNEIGINYGIHRGFPDKILIYCTTQRRQKATIYDFTESNTTDGFQLILKKGIKINLKFNMGEKFKLIHGDIYLNVFFRNRLGVAVYKKGNIYKYEFHVVNRLRGTRVTTCTIVFDPRYELFYLLYNPGCHVLAMRLIYDPIMGLRKNGSGQIIFKEMDAHFNPRFCLQINFLYYYFDPRDGSFVHIGFAPPKYIYLSKAAIYKRI